MNNHDTFARTATLNCCAVPRRSSKSSHGVNMHKASDAGKPDLDAAGCRRRWLSTQRAGRRPTVVGAHNAPLNHCLMMSVRVCSRIAGTCGQHIKRSQNSAAEASVCSCLSSNIPTRSCPASGKSSVISGLCVQHRKKLVSTH